jgi:hypothetical protein
LKNLKQNGTPYSTVLTLGISTTLGAGEESKQSSGKVKS